MRNRIASQSKNFSAMKKIVFLFSLILILNSKTQAQLQIPFSGYELSNYEVGDTLEYFHYQAIQTGYAFWNQIFVVTEKFFLSNNDSIDYTFKSIIICCIDTLHIIITNDSIYNNDNNILKRLLYPFDTTGLAFLDSSSFQYDTISGLKNLSSYISSDFSEGYSAIQNIGITRWFYFGPTLSVGSYKDTLIYAHLSHYGIYGNYAPLGYNEISNPKFDISLSPNPATTEIKITNLSPTENQISIFNLLGQQVLYRVANFLKVGNSNHATINISDLPAGIYVVTIFDGEKFVCKKLVKE